jgi:hypothetical protein
MLAWWNSSVTMELFGREYCQRRILPENQAFTTVTGILAREDANGFATIPFMPAKQLHAPSLPAHRIFTPLLRALLPALALFATAHAQTVQEAPKGPEAPATSTAPTESATPADTISRATSVLLNESDVKLVPTADSTIAVDSASPLKRTDSLLVLSSGFWKKNRFDLYDVTERELVSTFYGMTGREEEPDREAYQVLLFTDSVRHAYLLRAGTEVVKLPDTALTLVRQKIRAGALTRGGSTELWRNFWNPGDPLQPYLWKTGLEFRASLAATVVRRAAPQVDRQYDLTFLQRPLPWIATEIGGHMTTSAGGLRRNIYDPLDRDPNFGFWGGTYPWWHAAIGVPGVKWEVSLANRVFPEFYWLDPNGGEGSYKAGRTRAGFPVDPNDTNAVYADGTLMREWSQGGDPIPSRGNLAHALHLKAGGFLYSAYYDPEVYRSIIHRAFFGDLPAPFGAWGFGFISANGSGHTLMRLDIAPTRFGLGKSADGNYLRILFLRIDAAYRDPKTFRIGLSTSALLDSRTFRPGDSR